MNRKRFLIITLTFLLVLSSVFNTQALAETLINNNLDEDGIPIGEFKALDKDGNLIDDIENYLKRRDSGWMYTRRSETYELKDYSTIVGYFYSSGKFRCDFNKNITSFGEDSSRAWAAYDPDNVWAKSSVTGSYKPNSSTGRLTITGEAGDILLQIYGGMHHTYYFYGNGTWSMTVFG